MRLWVLLAAGAGLFAVLATANSGGYRFGVSDQAFYAPAIIKRLQPSFYPRDTPLIESEARFTEADEIVGGLARALNVDLPPLFFAIYLLTLVTLFGAAVALARAYGLSWWAVTVLILLLTVRHRIAKTGANSLEGYMHPRELAFALGVAMLACAVRRRYVLACAGLAAAALIHPTSALWFGVMLVVAAATSEPRARGWLVLGVGVFSAVAVWALTLGPLAGRLVRMDDAWLAVLAGKDYLFPTGWPVYAWALNLAYPVVIGLAYRRRRALGVAAPGERGVVAGFLTLFALFLISVPLAAARIALAVQLQVTRVLWLMDFGAVVYVAWWLTSGSVRSRVRASALIVAVVAALSAARGFYMLRVERADHRLIVLGLPDTPWVEAMSWLQGQPAGWQVLADPGHAYKYGVSVRVAARRDVVLEESKDSAVAIYDREVALRVADRAAALADFTHLTAADMQALRRRYGVDVAVVEGTQPLDLPELHRNSQFVVYDLR